MLRYGITAAQWSAPLLMGAQANAINASVSGSLLGLFMHGVYQDPGKIPTQDD